MEKLKSFIVTICIVLFIILVIILAQKQFNKSIDSCVAMGYTRDYCISKL